MLEWSAGHAAGGPQMDEIVVALPSGERAPQGTLSVPGGATRSEVGPRRAGGARRARRRTRGGPRRRAAAGRRPSSFVARLGGDRAGPTPPSPRAGHGHRQAGGADRAWSRRWTGRACGRSRRRRRSGREVLRRALDVADEVLGERHRRCALVERGGRRRAGRRVPAREPQGHHGAGPARGRAAPRGRASDADRLPRAPAPGRPRHRPPSATSRPRTPSATARRGRARASPSWASRSTSTASAQALDIWDHPWWRDERGRRRRRVLRVRAHETDLRLGIEADFVPGPRGPMRELAGRSASGTTWSARSTSWATRAVDSRRATTSGAGGDPERVWRRYFETARRGGAHAACSTSWPTPTWSRSGATERPRPDGDLRRFYELAMEGIAESRTWRSRSRPPGCASRSARSTPRRPFLEMCLDAGMPGRAVQRRPRPRAPRLRLRAGASSCSTTSASPRSPSSRAASGGWSRSDESRPASATTPTASPTGAPLVLGGVEIPHERGPATATPTPTCSPTRSSTRCWARPALGDIGEHFPDTDER